MALLFHGVFRTVRAGGFQLAPDQEGMDADIIVLQAIFLNYDPFQFFTGLPDLKPDQWGNKPDRDQQPDKRRLS
jgi:hypothetical protein